MKDFLLDDKNDLIFENGDLVTTDIQESVYYDYLQRFKVAFNCYEGSFIFNSAWGVDLDTVKSINSETALNIYLNKYLSNLVSGGILGFSVKQGSLLITVNKMEFTLLVRTDSGNFNLNLNL